MKLKDRLSYASKILFSTQLSNSIGNVVRNSGNVRFTPSTQLTGITYKAIDKIGQSVSVYKPEVSKRNGEAYVNHPIYNLFSQPNPRQASTYFTHLDSMIYEIYGESFWYLVKGERSDKVQEIYQLNPSQMELVIEDGELVGYKLHKNNGDKVPFDLDEIVHDMRPNPFNEWRGISVMERALVYIDTEITTSVFTLNYMKNNASPSGIVSLPNMEKESFKQFTQEWRENYEGPQNAGKTGFIRGGEASFKAVGATLKDVDQEVTRKMAKDDVLMMLDVPKGLLGVSGDKGMGRSETEALEYIFAKYKIEPMMTRLDRMWEKILKISMPADSSTISHTSPIPEDKEFAHKQNKELVNIALTPNEVRARLGYGEIPGGDDLNPDGIAPVVSKEVKRLVMKKSKTAKEINNEQESFRKKLVETNDVYAKKLKTKLSDFARKQESMVIDKINVSSKAFDEWLFNIKEESEAMATALTPVVIELMEAQTEDVANFITGELITVTDEMRRTVEQNILKISGVYNQDTITQLEKTLTEGQSSGESLNKLKKRVENVYSDAKGYRAERIARAESLKASNRAAELTYKQSGYTTVKWFTNPGACEFCQSYSGRTKQVGSNFTVVGDVVTGVDGGQLRVDYSDIDVPPLHPNCTCSLIPVTE